MTRPGYFRSLLTHTQTLLSRHHQLARASFRKGAAAVHESGGQRAGAAEDVIADAFDDDTDDGEMALPMVVVDEAEFLKSYWEEMNISDENEKIFMEETLRGITRHHQTLEVVLDLFYKYTGGRYLRSEYNLFAIIVYLATFRLSELTFPNFKAFVRCCDATKMARLIGFLFDSEHLASESGCLQQAWGKILDSDHVKVHLVVPLLSFAEDARKLLDELLERSEKGMVPKKSSKGATEPEPFLLTVPNPRKLPLPKYSHSTLTKARPIPKYLATGTGEREALAKAREENRKRQQQVYEKASKTLFSVAKRPPPRPKTTAGVTAGATTAHQFTPIKPRPIPPPTNVEVKLTTTTILREDALVRKNRMEELKALQEIETTLRDASEFSAWREQIRAKEEEEKRAEAEKRRLQVLLAHELALEARDAKIKENQVRVQEIKTESEAIKSLAETRKKQEEEENKLRREEIREVQESVERAKQKVVEENQRKASNVTLESQSLKEKAQRDAEVELVRKTELIRQIRLLERSIPAVGEVVKHPDLTQSSNVGLLGEMSIVELHERLLMVRKRHEEWQMEKRDEIRQFKLARQSQMASKLDTIVRERGERRLKREEEKVAKSVRSSAYGTGASASRFGTPGRSGRSSVLSMGASIIDGELGLRMGGTDDPALRALQEKIAAKKLARIAAKNAKLEAAMASVPVVTKAAAANFVTTQAKEAGPEDHWCDLEETEDDRQKRREALQAAAAAVAVEGNSVIAIDS